jgi:hypothetical protein
MTGPDHQEPSRERDHETDSLRAKSDKRIQQLLAPNVSPWLTDALRVMTNRDPVDALDDAEILVEVLTTGARIDELHANTSVSFWLKDALRAMTSRDQVEAIADAKSLVDVLTVRLEEIQGSR